MLFQLRKAILLGRKEARTNQDIITYFPKHKTTIGMMIIIKKDGTPKEE